MALVIARRRPIHLQTIVSTLDLSFGACSRERFLTVYLSKASFVDEPAPAHASDEAAQAGDEHDNPQRIVPQAEPLEAQTVHDRESTIRAPSAQPLRLRLPPVARTAPPGVEWTPQGTLRGV